MAQGLIRKTSMFIQCSCRCHACRILAAFVLAMTFVDFTSDALNKNSWITVSDVQER